MLDDDETGLYGESALYLLSLFDEQYKTIVKTILVDILNNIIIMIYPFAPFIGEELYQALPEHKKSIMLEAYPEAKDYKLSKEDLSDLANVEMLYKMIQ